MKYVHVTMYILLFSVPETKFLVETLSVTARCHDCWAEENVTLGIGNYITCKNRNLQNPEFTKSRIYKILNLQTGIYKPEFHKKVWL